MLTEAKITWEALQALIADAKRGVAVSLDTRDALGEEIVRCEVLQGGGLYRQLLCLRLFDQAEGWEGWKSMEAWMAVKLGLSYKTANERIRVARSLANLPKIDAAFREGQLSYTKVRAIHDVATPENEETLLGLARSATGEQLRRLVAPLRAALKRSKSSQAAREQERRVYFLEDPDEDLVELRAMLLPEEAAVVRKMLEVALELEVKLRRSGRQINAEGEAEVGVESAAAESSAAESSADAPDQSEADLPAASGGRVSAAGEGPGGFVDSREPAEQRDLPPARRGAGASSCSTSAPLAVNSSSPASAPTPSQGSAAADLGTERFTLADALVFAAESFLANPPRAGVPAGRREILIHAYPEPASGAESDRGPNLGSGLLETGDGLSAETVQRLACDGATVRVKRGPEGEILDMGRRTRRIGRSLGRALEVRDRCCRFPGCARRAMLDAHHIVAWSQGGKTKLANLVRLCRTHHRHVHEGGWTLRRDAQEQIEFLDPWGKSVGSPGRLPEVAASEAHVALLAECRSRGLEAEPEQLTALDGGAPVDYGYATSVLADCCGFEVDPSRLDQAPSAIAWLRRQDVA